MTALLGGDAVREIALGWPFAATADCHRVAQRWSIDMDVRKMFEKEFLYSYDLEGRDVTVTISRVTGGTLVGTGGKSTKKPLLYFNGTEKALGLNITNARVIAGMYGGFDSALWIGKKITLYPTTTTFGSQTVDCIRIRPTIPNAKAKAEAIRSDVEPPPGVVGPGISADDINFGGER